MSEQTTHRPSFMTGNNSFWTINESGNFSFDGVEYMPGPVTVEKFQAHARDGYHPDCVICQDKMAQIEQMPELDIAALVAAAIEDEAPDPRFAPRDIVTRESMELRSNEVSNALKNDELSPEERESLWQELAEIAVWLQKDDQRIGDYSDARLCARHNDQL